MKRTHIALWFVVIATLFFGCESNPIQPGTENQSVLDHQTGSLAKITIVAELDESVPTGTTASGGESLAGQKWTDSRLGNFYEVHINEHVQVNFDGLTSVTVDSPVNLEYLSSSDTWIGMLYGGTVSAKAIWTDSPGSGSLTLNSSAEFEEADEHTPD